MINAQEYLSMMEELEELRKYKEEFIKKDLTKAFKYCWNESRIGVAQAKQIAEIKSKNN